MNTNILLLHYASPEVELPYPRCIKWLNYRISKIQFKEDFFLNTCAEVIVMLKKKVYTQLTGLEFQRQIHCTHLKIE